MPTRLLDRCRTTNPVWCVAFAFALTTAAARWVSHVDPAFHYNISGLHIHHYMYGIFMITFAGYCALTFKGPRATFWIALLFGWGAGFTFDEMGMWLKTPISPILRWDHDGLLLGFLALALIGVFSLGQKKKTKQRLAEVKVQSESDPRQFPPVPQNTIEVVVTPQED